MEAHERHGTCQVCQFGVHEDAGGKIYHPTRPSGQAHEPDPRWTCCDEHQHTHEFTREGSIGMYHCECGEMKSAEQFVLDEAFTGDPCDGIAGLMTNRQVNTGGGRASDAARYIVRLHAGLGCEGFRARYEQGTGSHVTLDQAAWSLVSPL